MEPVTIVVPQSPKVCWRAFIDASALTAWIPGLRRAQVIATEDGHPAEIHFEFASSLVYTLVYTYDVDRLEVRWEPKLGRRDGVTGFARFEPHGDHTLVTYLNVSGEGRSDAERALGDPGRLVAAFAAFVAGQS